MTTRRSAFFFIGRLEPAELANFNIQNVFLSNDDAVLEVFGHVISIWWPSRERSAFEDLADEARSWLATICSLYYLVAGRALDLELTGWVEALDVTAREAIVGSIDKRFHKVDVVEEDDAVNPPMLRAIDLSRDLRGRRELERAAHEVWAAANDPSVEAFLKAFRALECLRWAHDEHARDRKAAWKAMAQELDVSPDQRARHQALADAAEAIRHGDLPTTRAERHAVNEARDDREALLDHAAAMVKRALKSRLQLDVASE